MKTLIAFLVLLTGLSVQSQAEVKISAVTAADKTFFGQLRTAVLSDNVTWLSEVVSYPFVLRRGSKTIKLKNRNDFTKNSGNILTVHLKSVVRKQSAECLFKNWQGVRIGDGEIWFSEVTEKDQSSERRVHRIIAINLHE